MRRLATILLLTTFLAACSSGGADPDAPASITLSRVDAAATKDTVIPREASIIDLDVQWQTWNGQAQPSIQVSGDSVQITGDPNAPEAVIGAHDYQIALEAGATYVLDVDDLSTGGAAALIFPYQLGGQLVPLVLEGWAIATPGQPFRFTAPDGIVGFWIQVQNRWGDPGTDATVRPVFGTVTTPPIDDGEELIDLAVRFERWQTGLPWFDYQDPDNCVQPATIREECRAPGVTVDGDTVVIEAAERRDDVDSVRYQQRPGVQWYPDTPLSGLYELSIRSEMPYSSVYLVGLNSAGRPDLRNYAAATTGTDFTRNTLIDIRGVPGFAISVARIYSPFPGVDLSTSARLQISLKKVGE